MGEGKRGKGAQKYMVRDKIRLFMVSMMQFIKKLKNSNAHLKLHNFISHYDLNNIIEKRARKKKN